MKQTKSTAAQAILAQDADTMVADGDGFWPRPLLLSTASKIWRKHTSLQSGPAGVNGVQCATHATSAGSVDAPCIFCGFACTRNETHHRNDNHQDTQPDNLGPICAICHRWQHLGDLPSGDAYLCYLPGLSPQDASHLLRTVLVALGAGEADLRADAHALLNWMASHRVYVQQTWGSCEPAVFASALLRQSADEKEWREISFEDLALVVSPACVAETAACWRSDAYRDLPVNTWPQVHHGIVHAPL
ncbi:MAG: HNH endonuclease [Burkholderiaceae bacterium]|nr:HNH endonuclease [Burkholderiaceae bacterium]